MSEIDDRDPRRPGFHRVLILLYAVFTVAAGARAIVQLAQNADEAPVAYTLSALSRMYLRPWLVRDPSGSQGAYRFCPRDAVVGAHRRPRRRHTQHRRD